MLYWSPNNVNFGLKIYGYDIVVQNWCFPFVITYSLYVAKSQHHYSPYVHDFLGFLYLF